MQLLIYFLALCQSIKVLAAKPSRRIASYINVSFVDLSLRLLTKRAIENNQDYGCIKLQEFFIFFK